MWRRREQRRRGQQDSPLIVLVARRSPLIALIVLVAFITPVVFYALRNLDAFDPGSPWSGFLTWYDGEDGTSPRFLSGLGSVVLLALPALLFLVLRGDYETGPARVIGDIWDVLTFWPRRFHPIAVPTYAERAVPELRARVQMVKDESGGLVVVGYSQGSVLAPAIASAVPTEKSKVYLVTIGSPLGTLYGPTWPAYIPRLLKDVGDSEPPGGR